MKDLDAVDRALVAEMGAQIPDSAWRVVEVTETHRVSQAVVELRGKSIPIQRRELLGDEELQKINNHLYETSDRFSQREVGAMGTPVANIPMSMVFNPKTEIADKLRSGDRDHLTWWLNQEENRPFRTHKGKL